MSFIKHVGKHGDRRVAILYRTVPDEQHMALVIYPDTLSAGFHDSVMKVIESATAQGSESLSDVMFRSLLPDGRPMLGTLHKEGKLKKVQTNQIVITPNAASHVRLDELNEIMDGMAAGGDAAKKLADLDANTGLVSPAEKRAKASLEVVEDVVQASDGLLDDAALGNDMLAQSQRMAQEGASLVAESKRLAKEAVKLNPALKPKRAVAKKVVTK